jgi:type II secretory pathway pseudopilin PulG
MHARTTGFTVIELLFALALATTLAGIATPRFSAALDRVAVSAAMDAFVAQVTRARALALAKGGARLMLDVNCACSWLEHMDGRHAASEVWFGTSYGVTLLVDGFRDTPLELSFDALGIGRLVNRTVRFRRGSIERRSTLSAYGRVRTW